MEDVEVLKRNCVEYAHSHGKSIGVLRMANGATNYRAIAKSVGLHHTKVSSLLKKAAKLGLVKKISAGIYKKYPGVLGYMPNLKEKDIYSIGVPGLIKKINKRKIKKGNVFSTTLSIPSRVTSNLNKMADAYCLLFAVENTLRGLIREVLSKKKNWWENFVPEGIKNEVTQTKSKAPYHAASRLDDLEFTHLGQLKEIIISKKNWSEFLPYLNEKNKNNLVVIIDRAIPSRNAIGHSIPLAGGDIKVVGVRFNDILKMIR